MSRRSVLTMFLILLMLILSLQPSLGYRNPEPEASDPTAAEAEGLNATRLSPSYCKKVVAEFGGLTEGLELPDHLMKEDAERAKGDFNVSLYFTVLDRLSMEPGYQLDYVYDYAGIGGHPVLYARPAEKPAYRNIAEYLAADNGSEPAEREDFYQKHIVADGSPESFFQLALLRIQGEQFYQFWHAFYNDDIIVCDQEDANASLDELRGWIGEDEAVVEGLLADVADLDLAPIVSMDEEEVNVEVALFTKWGGFIRDSVTMKREFPHEILAEEAEVLVPYDCGIMF